MENTNKIILHRGYKGKYPENSRISFIKAIAQNLSFETDIRISKDNVPFIIHDDSLDRLFGVAGRIKYHDSSYLEQFFYVEDNESGLLSLEELCILIKENNFEKDIFIHIKEINDIHETIKVLKKHNIIKNINFFACYELTLDLIDIIKKRYPEFNVGLNVYENSPYNKEEYFEKADFIWADEVNIKYIDKKMIDLAHKLDKKIYAPSPDLVTDSVFKHDVEKRWIELLELGIDGIFTDMPEEFKRIENKNCIFCYDNIKKDEILHETENFYVKTGYMTAAPGHVMIISKKHLSCLADIPDELISEYKELCDKVDKAINKVFGKTFFLDFGPGLQSVKHQHTHFIPLKSKEYDIKDFIKEAIIPTKAKFEKGDLYQLKEVYSKEKDYTWFGVNGVSYIYHINKKLDPKMHFGWRSFLINVKNVKSIPISWRNTTDEIKELDKKKTEITRDRLIPLLNEDHYHF